MQPLTEILSDLAARQPLGRLSLTSPCESVTVVLDTEQSEFYVEAHYQADPDLIEDYLNAVVFPLGYELIDDEECEPDMHEDGQTRIYLAPALVDQTDRSLLMIPTGGIEPADSGRAKIGLLSKVSLVASLVLAAVAPILEAVSS